MALLVTQQWLGIRCFAIDQLIRPALVEPHDPVAHDLESDTTNAGRFAPAVAVVNRGQCQKPPDL